LWLIFALVAWSRRFRAAAVPEPGARAIFTALHP
jgi:hypothetical protein